MGVSGVVKQAVEYFGFVPVKWVKRDTGSGLFRLLGTGAVRPRTRPIHDRVAARYNLNSRVGAQPVWEGYGQPCATRTPNQVRTGPTMGRLYTGLVVDCQPSVLVEFGSAFGVSGMFWLAGLETAAKGHLYTFEPNEIWAEVARSNLAAISDRFTLTVGTFEDNLNVLPDQPIDMAFIDAIHTSEFVGPQFDLVAARSRPGSIIILDDINFSTDMRGFWLDLAVQPRIRAAAMLGERVGIVELV